MDVSGIKEKLRSCHIHFLRELRRERLGRIKKTSQEGPHSFQLRSTLPKILVHNPAKEV